MHREAERRCASILTVVVMSVMSTFGSTSMLLASVKELQADRIIVAKSSHTDAVSERANS
jgi:hypothetical protein